MIRADSTSDFEQIVDSSPASRDEDTNSDAEFHIETDFQTKTVKLVKEKSLSELISGLEERLLSVITRNHEETTEKINKLESRMEEKLKKMETTISTTDGRRAEAFTKLMTFKQQSKEKKEVLLSELKTQISEIKEIRSTEIERVDKIEGEKKTEKKCVCHAARKGTIECFGKIKSRCMKPFAKGSTGVTADIVVASEADDATQLHSLVLTNRKACRVAFRAEGAKETRRWFVSGITEPPPCTLRVGDEIVTIGGVAVAGVSLERLKEMVGDIQETGNVEVKREKPETQA